MNSTGSHKPRKDYELMSGTNPVTPTASSQLFRRYIGLALIADAALIAVAALIGWLCAGTEGALGGLIGGFVASALTLLTPASILLANRFSSSDLFTVLFFIVVLGGWLLKFVTLLVLIVTLRDAEWLNGTIMLLTLVVGVLISLALDVVVVARSRLGNVPDVNLPKVSDSGS